MKHTFLTILLITFLASSLASKAEENNNTQIVKKFFAGLQDPAKINQSLDLLADDYKFTNPLVSLNSKAEFISLASEIGKVLTGIKIIRIAENDGWVSVNYEFYSSIPGLEKNFANEWFKIENGKIVESHMNYDMSEWRKIYAQMNEGEEK